jgi:hypothetical protein
MQIVGVLVVKASTEVFGAHALDAISTRLIGVPWINRTKKITFCRFDL